MKKKTIMAIAGMAGCAALSYYENYKLAIKKIVIHHAVLPASFQGYRILHISDLHNTCFGYHQRQLIKAINDAQPDCIVITGDLLDKRRTTAEHMEPIRWLMEAIKDSYPIFYVPGNHEGTSRHYPYLRNYLLQNRVYVLENKRAKITRNNESIAICGIKDPKFYPQRNDEEAFLADLQTLKNACGDMYSILLSHRPERIALYYQCGFHLAFCGHAHGGQFRLPAIGSVYAPNQGFLPCYVDGQYNQGTTTMIVSRGLGNSRLPQRIHNRPQLIMVTLHR